MKAALPVLFIVAMALVCTAHGGLQEHVAAQQLFLLNLLKMKGDTSPQLEVQRKMLEHTLHRGKRQAAMRSGINKPAAAAERNEATEGTMPMCTTRPIYEASRSGSDPVLSAKEKVVIKMLDRPYRVYGEGNSKIIWLPAPPRTTLTGEGIQTGAIALEGEEQQEAQTKSKAPPSAPKNAEEEE